MCEGRAGLGISIRKKDYARAVIRNRIKRVIRENFRQNMSDFADQSVVVCVRGGLDMYAPLAKQQLHQRLQPIWQKIKTAD